ncbi:MAG TPA: hypothetical protein VI248_01425, partial [Kineosporiaceae bacterium]
SEARDSASQAATTIIQPASPATGRGLVQRILISSTAGLLLALIGGAVIILARARGDARLRRRDDLTDAVGTPVLASVASRPQDSVAGWSALLETSVADPVEQWAFRQALKALAARRSPEPAGAPDRRPGGLRPDGDRTSHPAAMTVLSLAGDERGVAVGPQLAAFAASRGIVTRLVLATGREHAPSLWAACGADRGAGARSHLDLVVVDSQPSAGRDDAAARPDAGVPRLDHLRSAELTVVVAVVDPARPQLVGVPVTPVTVLAVAPGVATRVQLARLALGVEDGDRHLDAVIVADPDPSDTTTGRQTLVRRVRQAPLPVRLTGPSSAAVPGTVRKGRR